MAILYESVKSNLISISIAARKFIDVEKFYTYNSLDDIYTDIEVYYQIIDDLRSLHEMVGATYIYVLKKIDDKYYFIFLWQNLTDVLPRDKLLFAWGLQRNALFADLYYSGWRHSKLYKHCNCRKKADPANQKEPYNKPIYI